MKRRLFSLFLVFALVLGCLPMTTSADFHEHESYYCIGDGVKRSYTQNASGAGWSYTASTRTLTLNNFSYPKSDFWPYVA